MKTPSLQTIFKAIAASLCVSAALLSETSQAQARTVIAPVKPASTIASPSEVNPFIRAAPEDRSAGDCTGDYSVSIDMKKTVLLPGENGELTVTVKGVNILPKPLPQECLAAWFRFRAYADVYNATQALAEKYPFTFYFKSCVATSAPPPNTVKGDCLPNPSPIGSFSKPHPVGVGVPGGYIISLTMPLNYVTERVYTVEVQRRPGNDKAWEFSKTAFTNSPAGTPNRWFKATIESNTSYVVDNNPKNDVDMIYFRTLAWEKSIKLIQKDIVEDIYYFPTRYSFKIKLNNLIRYYPSKKVGDTFILYFEFDDSYSKTPNISNISFTTKGYHLFDAKILQTAKYKEKITGIFKAQNIDTQTSDEIDVWIFMHSNLIKPDFSKVTILDESKNIIYTENIDFDFLYKNFTVGNSINILNSQDAIWDSIAQKLILKPNINIKKINSSVINVSYETMNMAYFCTYKTNFKLADTGGVINIPNTQQIQQTYSANIGKLVSQKQLIEVSANAAIGYQQSNPFTSCRFGVRSNYGAYKQCAEKTADANCLISAEEWSIGGSEPDKNSNGTTFDDIGFYYHAF